MSAVLAETVSYGLESIDGLWDELDPLIREHYEEIAHFKDIPLEPHREAYALMQKSGALRVFTARMDGVLIGYVIFTVAPALHYRSSVQAHEDVVFVSKEHRGTGVGLTLLKYAHASLEMEGVQVIYHHVKRAHPTLGKILEVMGFSPIDTIYGRKR